MWTAAVGECVNAAGVCVIGPNSGRCTENTVRWMTSPALTTEGFCAEVNVGAIHDVFLLKHIFPTRLLFVRLFLAGRGTCVLSECACADGWTGESCGCPVSTATCQSANGLLCSGRGRCTCGKCVCDDPQYSGEVCQRCPACQSTCQAHWYGCSSHPHGTMGLFGGTWWYQELCNPLSLFFRKCVDCHLSHGLAPKEAGLCNSTCVPLVGYVDGSSGREAITFTQRLWKGISHHISFGDVNI